MKNRRRIVLIAVMLVLIGFAAYKAYGWLSQRKGLPQGLIQANGRIEGDRYTVAGKTAGKILKLLVKEGQAVKAGQVILSLDDEQVRARADQARKNVLAFESQLGAARSSLAVMRQEVPLAIGRAEATLQRARAMVDKAAATEKQAERDALRFRELSSRGTVNRQRSEQADLAWTAAQRDLDAARTSLVQAESGLADEKLGWDRVRAKEEEMAALDARLGQARSALREAESALKDMTITAPASGIAMTRIRDEGEVVAAGSPILDIVDLDRLYLKVYVPEREIGKVRLGLPARIYTDAFPDGPFNATVKYISSRAEFTPKEVQTPDERVKLVYAVKLYLDANPDHRLTPGLPADAVIRWQEGASWTKPRW